MARKRIRRESTGPIDVPDRRDEDNGIAVPGGSAGDGGLFGDPSHGSGLFDAPDRLPGEMPGLFDRPRRPYADGAGSMDKPTRPAGVGLFDKPTPRRK